MQKNFQIKIIRPSGLYYQKDVIEIIFPAYDGLRAVLYNHAPFICLAGRGILKITYSSDLVHEFFYMQNGLLSVRHNDVSIITESIFSSKDVEAKDIEQKLRNCRNTPISSQYSFEQRFLDIQHYKFLLELANY